MSLQYASITSKSHKFLHLNQNTNRKYEAVKCSNLHRRRRQKSQEKLTWREYAPQGSCGCQKRRGQRVGRSWHCYDPVPWTAIWELPPPAAARRRRRIGGLTANTAALTENRHDSPWIALHVHSTVIKICENSSLLLVHFLSIAFSSPILTF